jgi:hypothetical protein
MDIHALARATAKETVEATFLALGVDVSTPKGVIRTQQNFAFLDHFRENYGKLKMYAMTTAIGLVATGVATIVWAHVLRQ